MSVNSSSFNAFHSFPLLSPIPFIKPLCFNSTTGPRIIATYVAANLLLLLPLSASVLCVGFQRWRRQRSTSTRTGTSHADLFTYHMVAMEMFSVMGSGVKCIGIYMRNLQVTMSGFLAISTMLPGQALFHCLTCVERYLDVVHPITYLGLRKTGGVRVRNISIGSVWLLCVGWTGVAFAYYPDVAFVPFFSLFTFCLLVSSFCSFSVLRALTRPSPGERARDGGRVDQSKKRAFHTIVAIMGVLLLRFAGLLVSMILYKSVNEANGDGCVVMSSALWFCLPSSLVLPLLFLHRAGKLACWRRST